MRLKKKKRKILLICTCAVLLSSCAKEEAVYVDVSGTEVQEQQETAEKREESAPEREENGSSADTEEAQERSAGCYVYICGAVEQPGVYEVPPHARIYEVTALAGGLTDSAAAESVNQAQEVSDGQMIYILTKEEAAQCSADPEKTAQFPQEKDDGRVDLNSAAAQELMTLPGIGASKAESIISYREKNGGFSSVEDIMKVEGIKQGVYNRIKDSIKVK